MFLFQPFNLTILRPLRKKICGIYKLCFIISVTVSYQLRYMAQNDWGPLAGSLSSPHYMQDSLCRCWLYAR